MAANFYKCYSGPFTFVKLKVFNTASLLFIVINKPSIILVLGKYMLYHSRAVLQSTNSSLQVEPGRTVTNKKKVLIWRII